MLRFGALFLIPILALSATQVPPHTPNEPLRSGYDHALAHQAAAQAALQWQDDHDCVTCHTNGLFLVAGASQKGLAGAYQQSRAFALAYLDRYLKEGRTPRGQHGAIEGIVATSAFLAIGEGRGSGTVSIPTRDALRHAITRMSEDGHYPAWLRCDWPPYEVDHHFGVTLMLVALGTTPDSFKDEPEIAQGMARLQGWLNRHPPRHAHHMGMCLWADSTGGIDLPTEQRKQYIQQCLDLQQEDGGWSVHEIGGWQRPDGTPQLTESEAYATAFMVFVLLESGLDPQTEAIQRGRNWLRNAQRESGRWYSRSPRRDNLHYLSNAATNFSIMALADRKLPDFDAEEK